MDWQERFKLCFFYLVGVLPQAILLLRSSSSNRRQQQQQQREAAAVSERQQQQREAATASRRQQQQQQQREAAAARTRQQQEEAAASRRQQQQQEQLQRKLKKWSDEHAGSLVNSIFSWSLTDVLNKNLLKHKVQKIPMTFTSSENYLNSYTLPLIEEAHADLCSSLEIYSHAPFIEIKSVDQFTSFKCFYKIVVAAPSVSYRNGTYEPKDTDLFLLSETKPKHVSDLKRYGKSYLIASIMKCEVDGKLEKTFIIKAAVELDVEDYKRKLDVEGYKRRGSLFAVYVLNMTTYNRIWECLNVEMAERRNPKIIKKIISFKSTAAGKHSNIGVSTNTLYDSNTQGILSQFNLNDSQTKAVLDCISSRQHQQNCSLNFIWGPPGTGKTKTISSLLWVLLTKKCRTVTCAPTNTAVVEVASRLVKLVTESSNCGGSLRDVVLFGNKDRMKIDDDLTRAYLDDRVDRLYNWFIPLTGWKHCVNSMIHFLEECIDQYTFYLKKENEKDTNKMNFKEFVISRFQGLELNLCKCMTILFEDLPSDSTTESVFHNMTLVVELINCLGTLLRSKLTDEDLKILFKLPVEENFGTPSLNLLKDIKSNASSIALKLRKIRSFSVQVLRSINEHLILPNILDKGLIQKFCLRGAILIFCTASSSFKLHNVNMDKPLEFLVVDEAAQLKECESLIPLQLSGIQHAVFIGDEYQLAPFVKSQIAENAAFGRSLFERFSSLGHNKHLLDVQYRMHPSISKFPITNFYNNKISDGDNVKCKSYKKQYLPGPMYGSYSFINIERGKEMTDNGRSQKNMIEVAAVLHLIKKLFEGMFSFIDDVISLGC